MKKSIALGLFDGLHIGHMAVILKAKELGLENGLLPCVFTFNKSGEKIITDDFKIAALKKAGIEDIYSPQFEDIKNLTADEFFEQIIIDKMSGGYIVCGEDFRFGKNALGDVQTLQTLCDKNNIKLFLMADVKKDNIRISSTKIRELLKQGRIKKANEYLGYNFSFNAVVKHGKQLGRTINFPTINQEFPQDLIIPKYGVYKTLTQINAESYKSITNIGTKPTVTNSQKVFAETHIIGLDKDLYNQNITLEFTDYIREEKKFQSIEELKRQIETDVLSIDN